MLSNVLLERTSTSCFVVPLRFGGGRSSSAVPARQQYSVLGGGTSNAEGYRIERALMDYWLLRAMFARNAEATTYLSGVASENGI